MSLEIREAGDDDLPAVLALYAQPEFDNGPVLPLDEAQQLLATFRQYPSYRLFVACHAGDIVGTYTLLIMHKLAHLGAPSAIVEDVAVSPQQQGMGIGKAMMAHAMRLAGEAGCYKLALSSNQKRVAAHAFYESLGFQRHGFSFVIGI